VHEANRWFPQQAAKLGFAYDTTSNWQNLNASFLARYQVVVFLESGPSSRRNAPLSRRTWMAAGPG
jgi:nuclear transport factor 2 (NTF2) superfamily protein